jgi:2,3-bisphosphoglycerate-independent phosphoglycerate mutase
MAFLRPDFEKIQSFDLGYDPRSNAKIGKVSFSETFTREKIVRNLFFTTMTEYAKDLPVNGVVFKVEKVEDCLSVVLSRASLPQMHMAESEKERFVTYYFDGWREEPQTLSDIKIVPSPKVSTYDKKPEMSLPSLTSAFRKEVLKDKYQFFIVNIANPDLVGHTGNIKATIKAVECVDKYISEMVNVTLGHDGCVFLTADHGNAEELLSYPTASFFYTSSKGNVNTEHSNNPVPLIVISNGFRGTGLELPKGILGDVAPSILAYMGVQKPLNMTGKNLLSDVISKPG